MDDQVVDQLLRIMLNNLLLLRRLMERQARRAGHAGPRLAYLFMDQEEAAALFQRLVPPPTSRQFVEALAEVDAGQAERDLRCPICLEDFVAGHRYVALPCHHKYHKDCVTPWLHQRSSCSVCGHKLPTDDAEYEELRREFG